jgi:hypothetical protein
MRTLPDRASRLDFPIGNGRRLPLERQAMMIRSGGFYHGDTPSGPEPPNSAGLAIWLVVVSAVGAAIVVLARAFLLTATR